MCVGYENESLNHSLTILQSLQSDENYSQRITYEL